MEQELRQLAQFARVGQNQKGRPSTIASFKAEPEVVRQLIAHLQEQERQKQEEARQVVADKYATEKAEREAKLAQEKKERADAFRKWCAQFPELSLSVKEDQYNSEVLNAEGEPIIGIDYRLKGYHNRTPGLSPEVLTPLIQKEKQIHEFRKANIDRVMALEERLKSEPGAPEIRAYNLEGDATTVYRGITAESRKKQFSVSHSLGFSFPKLKWTEQRIEYEPNLTSVQAEWSEEGLARLEQAVDEYLRMINEENGKAMEKLKTLNIKDSAVEAHNAVIFSNIPGQEGSKPYRLEVSGAVVPFPTLEHAKAAEAWALKEGAFLPWHQALLPYGDGKWARMAKEENWEPEKSAKALAVLKGEPIIKKKYPTTVQSTYDGKGTGQYFSSTAEGWFLGGHHVWTEEEIEYWKKFAQEAGMNMRQIHEDDLKKEQLQEEERQWREWLQENLHATVKVFNVRTRHTTYEIANIENLPFAEAIAQATQTMSPTDTSRRGFVVRIYGLDKDGTQCGNVYQSFSSRDNAEKVIEFLKSVTPAQVIEKMEFRPKR
jgi:hypothetical protein